MSKFMTYSRSFQRTHFILPMIKTILGRTVSDVAYHRLFKTTPNFHNHHYQFVKLITQPLSSPDVLLSELSPVVIMDAVDECGNAKDRKELSCRLNWRGYRQSYVSYLRAERSSTFNGSLRENRISCLMSWILHLRL
jgi:hypothetical protein